MPLINFLNPAQDSAKVSVYSRKVIEEILKKSGVPQITVTSTARTPNEQARIMYENIERHGVAHQKKLYGPSGDKVIDEYSALKAKGKASFQAYLEEIDRLLAGQKWCMGGQYTVADPYLLVFYRWANRQKMPVRELQHYSAVVDRILARPAVQKVMADEGITLD